MREILSQRLRELRESMGLSQKALSEKISVSAASIGYYENGDRIPGLDVAAELANFFGVSLDYLAGRSDSRTHEAADISARTGLTEEAVEVLVFMQKHCKKEPISAAYLALDEMLEGFATPRNEEEYSDWLSYNYPLPEKQKNEYADYFALSGRCAQKSKILELLVDLYHFPFWEDEELVMSPHLGITELRGGARNLLNRNKDSENNLGEIAWKVAENYDKNLMVIPLSEFADENIIRKISDELRNICKSHRPDAHSLEKWCIETAIAEVEELEEQEAADAQEE